VVKVGDVGVAGWVVGPLTRNGSWGGRLVVGFGGLDCGLGCGGGAGLGVGR